MAEAQLVFDFTVIIGDVSKNDLRLLVGTCMPNLIPSPYIVEMDTRLLYAFSIAELGFLEQAMGLLFSRSLVNTFCM